MSSVAAFIRGRPLLTFFTLTLVISWGAILAVIGPGGILGTRAVPDDLMALVYVAALLGPSVAGVVLTGIVDGRTGLRSLASGLAAWRIPVRWYAVALLTAPTLIMGTLFVLLQTSSVFRPAISTANDKASLLLTGLAMGLFVGLFEELGWTGFAVPRLMRRHGVTSTGLMVGFVWGLWHLPLFLASIRSSGTTPPSVYLFVLLFSFLPAYRVLMVWVWNHTASLLVTILMHVPLAASQAILIPVSLSGVDLVVFDLLFGGALWVCVAAISVANRLSRTRATAA